MQRCGVKFCLHLKNYGKIAESATWNNQKSLKPLQRNGFRDFSVVLQRRFARVPFEFPQSQRGSSRGRSPPRIVQRGFAFLRKSHAPANMPPACLLGRRFRIPLIAKVRQPEMAAGLLVLQRGFEPRTPCLKGIYVKTRKALIFLAFLDFQTQKIPHLYRRNYVKAYKIMAESAAI